MINRNIKTDYLGFTPYTGKTKLFPISLNSLAYILEKSTASKKKNENPWKSF